MGSSPLTYARLRFLTAAVTTAGGILLGVGAFCFSPSTESWIGLGVGSGLTITTVLAFATAGRGAVQRVLDLALFPVGIWTLVSARTIELAGHGASPSLVKWLGLSAGSAIFLIGCLALLAHELSVEADLRWALARLTEPETSTGVAGAGGAAPAPAPAPANGHRQMWLAPPPGAGTDNWRPPRRAGA